LTTVFCPRETVTEAPAVTADPPAGQFSFDVEGNAAVFQMFLPDANVLELQRFAGDQLDRPPDAAG
jgi:hypothetical protein